MNRAAEIAAEIAALSAELADVLAGARVVPAPAPREVAPSVRAAVLEAVTRQPGLSARGLRAAVAGHSNADADEAARALERDGLIQDCGAGRARAWHPRVTAAENAPTPRVTVAHDTASDDRAQAPQPTRDAPQRRAGCRTSVFADHADGDQRENMARPGARAHAEVEEARRR